MQRGIRQRIVTVIVFCLVAVGLVNTAPPERFRIDWTAMPTPAIRSPRSPILQRPAPARPTSKVAFAPAVAPLAAPLGATSVNSLAACDSPANEIVAENCLEGNSEWDISGDGAESDSGFRDRNQRQSG